MLATFYTAKDIMVVCSQIQSICTTTKISHTKMSKDIDHLEFISLDNSKYCEPSLFPLTYEAGWS